MSKIRMEYMRRAGIKEISTRKMECVKKDCWRWDLCLHGKAHTETSDCKNVCESHGKKCTEVGIIGTWSG